jgi:hypothetical protein
VVERGQHLDPVAAGRAQQGGQAGVHPGEVVQPAGGEELRVRTEDGGRGGVVRDQLEPVDLVAVRSRAARPGGRPPAVRPAHAPDRRGVLLLVQLQAVVVDPAVEVDGQLRDPHDRVRAHQLGPPVGQHHPPGEAELAVQPGVEQRAAVDLQAQLGVAEAAEVRLRLDREAGRVGVGADDPVRRTRVRIGGSRQATSAPSRTR